MRVSQILNNFINPSKPSSRLMEAQSVWTKEQDNFLQSLQKDPNLTQWPQIFSRIKMQFQNSEEPQVSPGCSTIPSEEDYRLRYETLTEGTSVLTKNEWTAKQEEILFSRHDEIGNKWAVIGNELNGKSDNAIKNHFYSRLRKALRRLNKIIHRHYKKEYKEIKVIVIYKIIEATEERFKEQPFCSIETSEYCTELKNKLLRFGASHQNENQEEPLSEGEQLTEPFNLIKELINFSKNYKRKTKKEMKNLTASEEPNMMEQENQIVSPFSSDCKVRKKNKVLRKSTPSELSAFESEGSEMLGILPSPTPSNSSVISSEKSMGNFSDNEKRFEQLYFVETRRRAKSKEEIKSNCSNQSFNKSQTENEEMEEEPKEIQQKGDSLDSDPHEDEIKWKCDIEEYLEEASEDEDPSGWMKNSLEQMIRNSGRSFNSGSSDNTPKFFGNNVEGTPTFFNNESIEHYVQSPTLFTNFSSNLMCDEEQGQDAAENGHMQDINLEERDDFHFFEDSHMTINIRKPYLEGLSESQQNILEEQKPYQRSDSL